MPFAYFARLSRRDQAVYLKSDAVPRVVLSRPAELWPVVDDLRAALAADDRARVEQAARALAAGMLTQLEVEPVDITVLAVRPELSYGELHGLYTRDDGKRPRIRVWMRTLRHKRVVAFATFLRTLLHELGHHLDYAYLKLADSFHTEGFFKRESSLFHQLVPESARLPAAPRRGLGGRGA
jgi:hypothetical protein